MLNSSNASGFKVIFLGSLNSSIFYADESHTSGDIKFFGVLVFFGVAEVYGESEFSL